MNTNDGSPQAIAQVANSSNSGSEPNSPDTTALASTADVSRIADTLMQSAPSVQEHAIAEHQRQARSAATQDAKGVAFDPAIHAGADKKTASGEWAKKRGRKAGGTNTPAASVTTKSQLGGVPGNAADNSRLAGAQAATLFVTVCRTVGGEEWDPIAVPEFGLDEMSGLQKVFGDYFAAKKMNDIPPGIALAFGVGAYMGPRFFRPKTRSRLRVAKEWLITKYLGWKYGGRVSPRSSNVAREPEKR